MFVINSYPINLNILDKYSLELRGRITKVTGLSGSGKTRLCNIIRLIMSDIKYNNTIYPDYYNNLVAFDTVSDSIELSNISELRDKLIFIDRADFLSKDLLEIIRCDRNNVYILFARTCLNLGLSPNYFCEFVNNGPIIQTSYRFSEMGWF